MRKHNIAGNMLDGSVRDMVMRKRIAGIGRTALSRIWL